MNPVYLNNAATSFPKPAQVIEAVHMNDFEIRSLADCYNDSLVRKFDFAEPIGEALIGHLGRDKKLDCFPDLPKSYFRIEAKENA